MSLESFEELMRQETSNDSVYPKTTPKGTSGEDAPTENRQSEPVGFFEDIAEGVAEYGQKAKENLDKYLHTRNVLAESLIAKGLYADENIPDVINVDNEDVATMTPEQEQKYYAFVNANKKFQEETLRPFTEYAGAAGVAGLIAAGATGGLSIPATIATGLALKVSDAFLFKDLDQSIAENGLVDTAVNMGLGMIPTYNFWQYLDSDEYAQLKEEHPGRAFMEATQVGLNSLAPVAGLAGKGLGKGAKYTKTKAKYTLEALREQDFAERLKADIESKEFAKSAMEIVDQVKKGVLKPTPESKAKQAFNRIVKEKEAEKDVSFEERVKATDGSFIDENVMAAKGCRDIPIRTIENPKLVKLTEIMAAVKSFSNFTFGHFDKFIPDDVLGYYKRPGESFHFKDAELVNVMVHEVGHFLDDKMGIQGCDSELTNLYSQTWKNNPYPDAQHRSEGIAEFTVEYVLNPDEARAMCPEFFKEFEKTLSSKPELKAKFDTLADLVQNWHNLPETARRGGSGVHYQNDTPKTPLKTKIKDTKDKIITDWLDDFHPIEKVAKAVEKSLGKVLPDEMNPVEAFRSLHSNIAAHINQVLKGRATPGVVAIMNDIIGGNVFEYHTFMNDVYNELPKVVNKITPNPEYLSKVGVNNHYEGFSVYMAQHTFLESASISGQHLLETLTADMTKVASEANILWKNLKDEVNPERQKAILKKLNRKKAKIEKIERKLNAILETKDKYGVIYNPNYKVSDFTIDTALDIIDTAPIEYLNAKYKLREVNHNFLNLMEHTGLISKTRRKELQNQHPDYVPLERYFEVDADGDFTFNSEGTKYHKIVDDSPVVRRRSLKGSARIIKDPLATYEQHWKRGLERGYKNQALQKFFGLNDLVKGLSVFFTEVGDDVAKSKERIVSVWVKGKKQHYQIKDKAIYELLQGSDGFAVPLYLKPFEWTATLLHSGITLALDFTIGNFLKDAIHSTFNSKSKKKIPDAPIIGGILGMFKYASSAERRAELMAAGINYSTRGGELDSHMDIMGIKPSYPEGDKYHLLRAGWNGVKKVGSTLKAPFKNVGTAAEMAFRSREYDRVYAETGDRLKAIKAAKTITVDFSQGGRVAKRVNRFVPFFNASIQGTRQLVKTLRDDPVVRERFAATAALATSVSLVSVYVNAGKKWYRDLTDDEKNRYWFVEVDGDIRKYPKPESIAIICSPFERVVEWQLNNDASHLSSIPHHMFQTFTPSVNIPLLRTMGELAFNKNLFTGGNIVSRDLQQLPTTEQYDINTSQAAIGAGQFIGWSPKKIDYGAKTLLGTAGKEGLNFIDELVSGFDTGRPTKHKSQMLGMSKTYKEPYTHSDKVDKMYEALAEHREADKAVAFKQGRRQYKGRETIYLENQLDQVKNIQRLTKQIINDKRLSGDEKAQRIAKLNEDRTSIALKGWDGYLKLTKGK